MKILVIDDESVNLHHLSKSLRDIGHEVLSAHNGEAGLQIFTKNLDTELVITDMQMPGIDGIEVTKEVKRIKPEVRVCVISGKFHGNTAEEAIQIGAEKAFLKPILIEKIRRELGL